MFLWVWYVPLFPTPPTVLTAVTSIKIVLYQILTIVYNLFFHPLRKFPGPILRRASSIPWAIQHVRGNQPFETHKLHEKYGPVVRITPNHLSFTNAQAFKDIYGHLVGNKSGHAEMEKAIALNKPFDDVPHSIVSAGREKHGLLRRALSREFHILKKKGHAN